MDADLDHQRSGNHGEDRGTDKSKNRMKFKNKRKVLRLNSPAHPTEAVMRVMDTTRIMCHPLLSRLVLQQRAAIGRGAANSLAVMPPPMLQPLVVLLGGKACRRRGMFSFDALP